MGNFFLDPLHNFQITSEVSNMTRHDLGLNSQGQNEISLTEHNFRILCYLVHVFDITRRSFTYMTQGGMFKIITKGQTDISF